MWTSSINDQKSQKKKCMSYMCWRLEGVERRQLWPGCDT